MPALPCVLLQRSAQELPSCLGRSHGVTRTSLSKAHKSSLQTEDGKHQSCPGAAHVTANPLVRKEDVGPCGGDRALLKQEPPARAQPFPISYGAPSNRGAFPPAARCDTPHPGRSNLARTVLHKEGSAHLHYCAPMSAPMTQNIPPAPKTSGGPLTLCPPPVHMTYSLTSKSILPPPPPSPLYTPIIQTELHKPLVSPRFFTYPNSLCSAIPFSSHLTLSQNWPPCPATTTREMRKQEKDVFFARIHISPLTDNKHCMVYFYTNSS